MADQGMSPACDVCGRQRGEVGARVECAVCHSTKKPRGRDAPMEAANGYCSEDCSGYRADPQVGDLWPGELRWVFGHGIMGNEAERCHAKSGEESDAAECYRLGYERMRRQRNETLVNAGSIGSELLAKLDRAELALECAKGAHFKAQLEHEERAAASAAAQGALDWLRVVRDAFERTHCDYCNVTYVTQDGVNEDCAQLHYAIGGVVRYLARIDGKAKTVDVDPRLADLPRALEEWADRIQRNAEPASAVNELRAWAQFIRRAIAAPTEVK